MILVCTKTVITIRVRVGHGTACSSGCATTRRCTSERESLLKLRLLKRVSTPGIAGS
jgi:hypothetical protein